MQPSLNFWPLLFTGFSSIGIFYSTRLLVRRDPKRQSDFALAVYVILQSLTLFEYVLYWTGLIYNIPAFCDATVLFPLLYGPCLLIYFDSVFDNQKNLQSYFPHAVPFIFFLIFKIPFYLSSADTKFYHIKNVQFYFIFDYIGWIKVLHMSMYAIVVIFIIRKQFGIGFMRSWARWIAAFYVLFIIMSAAYLIFSSEPDWQIQYDYYMSLASSATIFFMAWYDGAKINLREGNSIAESLIPSRVKLTTTSANESANTKYGHSALPFSAIQKIADELDRIMEKEKLYLENDLKLEKLASILNVSKHHISQTINRVHMVNFFDYINQKRIDEAKRILHSYNKKELNVLEVAYMVGYNHKGTFNSVFKKITGTTPTEYRKQIQSSPSFN